MLTRVQKSNCGFNDSQGSNRSPAAEVLLLSAVLPHGSLFRVLSAEMALSGVKRREKLVEEVLSSQRAYELQDFQPCQSLKASMRCNVSRVQQDTAAHDLLALASHCIHASDTIWTHTRV